MISIGVIFFQETTDILEGFFKHLTTALKNDSKKNSAVIEIIFVQNSKDENLELFLSENLKILQKNNVFLKTHLFRNSINNIAQARKKVVEFASCEWIYFTDPDVRLSEQIFEKLIDDIRSIEQLNQKEKILGITGLIHQNSENTNLRSVFNVIDFWGQKLNFAFQGTSKKVGLQVDHAPTAHLLLNKDVSQKLDHFSDEFDLCGEDLDLTHRATQKGCFIYFGSSEVIHLQNLNFRQMLKKSFRYGEAQALVFLKNGFCYQRVYRLIPALGVLFFAALLLFCNNLLIGLVTGIIVMFSLIAPQLGLTFLIVMTYGTATIYRFIAELILSKVEWN